ncbi:hypothetical protein VTH06DRAFT_6214 [Thermothelomyces fergusii]
MSRTQGTPSTASKLPRSANKGKAGFCWQGLPGAISMDIFDEDVELGDSEAEPASCFGQLGLSKPPSMSPHVLSLEQVVPPDGGGQGGPETQSRPSALESDHEIAAGPTPSHGVSRGSHHLHPLYRTQADLASLNSVGDTSRGASISDSELLHLEGPTMRSPRIRGAHLSTSEPVSPPSGVAGPRKVNRLGTLCIRIRDMAAALQGISSETSSESPAPSSIPDMSTPQPKPAETMPGWPQRPLSPFASGLPEDIQQVDAGSEPNLINGYLGGSFNPSGLLHDHFAHPLQLDGGAVHGMTLPTGSVVDCLRLPVSTLDGRPLWMTAPGSYLGDGGANDASSWPEPSLDAMDTDIPTVSYHHAAVNELGAPLNTGNQLHHQQSFEYPARPGTNDTASTTFSSNDMMLHMPQPCGIPPAVLHNDVSVHRSTRADHHLVPRPRAPSSSARHHHSHHQYGRDVSPRKGRTASRCGSASSSRIASASPSPRPPTVAPGPDGGSLLHRRSVSMQTLHYSASATGGLSGDGGAAIRKRKSWTARRTSSFSSLLHHPYHGLAATAAVATVAGGNDSPSASSSPQQRRRTTNTETGSQAALVSSASFPPPRFHSHSSSGSLDDLPSLESSTTTTTTTTTITTNKSRISRAQPPSLHSGTDDRGCDKDKDKDRDKNRDRNRGRDRDRDRERDQQSKAADNNKNNKQQQQQQKQDAKQHQQEPPPAADGFVNYTPQDRALLMTGVAPSGSSKTKARREREAAERHRALRHRLARVVALHAAAAAAALTGSGSPGKKQGPGPGTAAGTGTGTASADALLLLSTPPSTPPPPPPPPPDGLRRRHHHSHHRQHHHGGEEEEEDGPGSGSSSGPDLGACLSLGLDLDMNMGLGIDMGMGMGIAPGGLWNTAGRGTATAGGGAMEKAADEGSGGGGGGGVVGIGM